MQAITGPSTDLKFLPSCRTNRGIMLKRGLAFVFPLVFDVLGEVYPHLCLRACVLCINVCCRANT